MRIRYTCPAMALGDLINQRIGSLQLVELIGAGGVAEVYKARHVQDGSHCAVKVLRAELASDKQQVKTLERECAVMQTLDHAAIPRARRLETVAGRRAMVLDLVEGPTVHRLVQEGRRFDRLGVLLALCGIAGHLHQAQWVHNDLKLENLILRPDGKLALVDFGNVREVRAGGILGRFFARKQAVVGTPTYLAPELITGGAPTPSSDCYAIGICAHLLLVGSPPFAAERQSARLRLAVKEDAPSIGARQGLLPARLTRVLDACLHKDAELRPGDAMQLRQQLRGCFGPDLAAEMSALSSQLVTALDD